MNSKRLMSGLLAVTASIGLAAISLGQAQGIEGTKHNLSASGPGPVRVAGENRICVFCHTPHAASPEAPLWNRGNPGTYYQTYESTTLEAQVGQPTGSSRLCLSCHDGTIALTQTFNSRNSPAGQTLYLSPGDDGYLGTDLTDDHPISFVYGPSLASRNTQLRDPSTLPPELPLDHNQQLQCTTCHDPHDNAMGDFLRMSNTRSMMCVSCHDMDNWDQSVHAVSPASLVTASDTWSNIDATTVRDAACASCHRAHSAGSDQRLLRHEAEEANCLNCHDGGVSRMDIAGQLTKFSAHDSTRWTGEHDPTERPGMMSEHVECADCHNPHQARAKIDIAPQIHGVMRGVSGVNSSGLAVDEARFEYEVCFKCHSTTSNTGSVVVDRWLGNDDLRDEMSPNNGSYHPVVAPGASSRVPSLKQPYNPGILIYCSDCHGSDDHQVAGPHGSRYEPLLKWNYATGANTLESPTAYELCYDCHNRSSILSDQSFGEHRMHIVEENAPCSACHDPHGVAENTHLINFDRDLVDPLSPNSVPVFVDGGVQRGSCTLSCHGETHSTTSYPDD